MVASRAMAFRIGEAGGRAGKCDFMRVRSPAVVAVTRILVRLSEAIVKARL